MGVFFLWDSKILKNNIKKYFTSNNWKIEWLITAVFWMASSNEKEKYAVIANNIPINSLDLIKDTKFN